VLQETVQQLPLLPGVYLFKNKDGIIIYIGKAKSLKVRVSSYFQNTTDWKVKALLDEATSLEHIITNTETEALLLEAQLVQEYDPKFNVLLKTGQPFLYLMISNQSLPHLKIVRNKDDKGTYFGPFIHKSQARSVLNFLTQTFQLFCCNKKIENGCLDYHLGKCAGTCMKQFNKADYLFRILLVDDVLRQDHETFLNRIDTKIKEYSDGLSFEKARNLYRYKQDVTTIFKTLQAKYSDTKYIHEIAKATTQSESIDNYSEIAQELKRLLQLQGLPETIDCFDISHFQSRFLVGSCVRFSHGKPDKNKFRRFMIKTLAEQNDYAALQEVVMRRYKDSKELPDLILIDGGKGQRNAVLSLLGKTPCISLAKKEELLFSDYHPDGFALDVKTGIGKLLISLRDYAHHFAISYHKLLRKKGSFSKN
jgi:excinuclease ABC subunit C